MSLKCNKVNLNEGSTVSRDNKNVVLGNKIDTYCCPQKKAAGSNKFFISFPLSMPLHGI